MKISLIHLIPSSDKKASVEKALKLMKKSLEDNIDVVCLPEKFLYFGEIEESQTIESKTIKEFREFANVNNVNVILGNISILSDEKNKITNSSLIINRHGDIMHRDDEENPKIFELEGIKMVSGMCFDAKYPEDFIELIQQGTEVIFLSSKIVLYNGKILAVMNKEEGHITADLSIEDLRRPIE